MIVPSREGRETTAADHLATDSMARALEHIHSLVRAAQARLDISVSSAVTDALSPLGKMLDRIEERMEADDAES